jgi:hypothetical protein
LSGKLRVPHSFESRHLFMPGLHELRFVVRPAPGREQPVDPVALAL